MFELEATRKTPQNFFKLLKNANVFSPSPLGVMDLLIAGGRIVAIAPNLDAVNLPEMEIQVIDCQGNYVVPGFIDAHVHALGGGGGAGYGSRAPELTATECFLAGTTSIVACLGIDTLTRDPLQLLSKARSLQGRSLNVYTVVGGFELPPKTVTGDLKKDMYVIPEMLGVGEPAISDLRSSQPSVEYLQSLISEVHNGGRLSGKLGIVQFHLGGAPSGTKPLYDLLREGSIKHIKPLHFNRNQQLLEEAPDWAKQGGYIDLTANLMPPWFPKGIKPAAAAAHLREKGVPANQITISTDGNGVNTIFGVEFVERFPMSLIHSELKALVQEIGFSLDEALGYITANVADALGLPSKGRICAGLDADLVVMDPQLNIRHVISMGNLVVDQGERVNKWRLDT